MELVQFTEVLREKCLINQDSTIVVGVSGGPDSLVLAYWLSLAGCRIVVAHFNHHLRPTSDEEALFVERFAGQAGWPYCQGDADVRAIAQAQKISIEMAARNERYRFLFDLAKEVGAGAVAVGHQADDQAETVLMHLIRGSGLSGLRGMAYRSMTQWSAEIPLIRPLLGVSRNEVEAECNAHDWQPVHDETNDSPDYLRNRIRLELIPQLQTYNPQILRQLSRTADVLSSDYEVLLDATEKAWDACHLLVKDDEIQLGLSAFRANPEAIQRLLLRMGAELLRPGLVDLSFDAIQRALAFIASPPRAGKIEWALNLRLSIRGNVLVISERQLQLSAVYPQCDYIDPEPLPIPGRIEISASWRIETEVMLNPKGLPPEGECVWLDADKVGEGLWIRQVQSGDTFQPLGMDGRHVKVGDYFTNYKIPTEVRTEWPVVGFGSEIVWLAGLRPAENGRVTDTTQKVICLRLYRNEIME